MDVITLQPGTSGTRPVEQRPDWTPIAQRPDKYGVMAHTPNPTGYAYDAGGRVIIPRANRHGSSRGFNPHSPNLIMNVDPSDPVTGAGGIKVDMGKIDKALIREAAMAADDDATLAWALATQQAQNVAPAPPPPPREAPVGYGGYVVPAASSWLPSHRQPQPAQPQVPEDMNGHPAFNPAHIRPAMSPAVAGAPQGPSPMAMPVPIPSADPSLQQQPIYQQPPQPPQYQQPPYQPPAPTPMQPPPYPQPPYPPQQPIYQPPPPQPQVDMVPMMMGMMQALTQLTQAVQGMQRPVAPQPMPMQHQGPPMPQPVQMPALPPYQTQQERYQGVPGDEEGDEETEGWNPPKPHPVAYTGLARASSGDTRLDFLTSPPSRPAFRVVFDLGKGGKHSKHFHAVAAQGVCLSLVYDDRYDGDRFIPTPTEPGESILVKLPKRPDPDDPSKELPPTTLRVAVPDFHQSIGCLDILNLIILPQERIPSPRDVYEEAEE